MATQTATAAATGVMPRAGTQDQSVSVVYNSGTTAFSASATVVLLCKVPNFCTITNIVAHHTAGAGNAPADYGISIDSVSTFASGVTKGAIVLKNDALPYHVSTSDGATIYLTFTPTVATNTASVKCYFTAYYRMD